MFQVAVKRKCVGHHSCSFIMQKDVLPQGVTEFDDIASLQFEVPRSGDLFIVNRSTIRGFQVNDERLDDLFSLAELILFHYLSVLNHGMLFRA